MRIATWNVAWRSPKSDSAPEIQSRVMALNPSIVCFTEASGEYLTDGHTISSEENYGYPIKGQRRKVSLWGREEWTSIDATGSPDLPSGRFVYGELGAWKIMGVCIPWRDAHVATGRKDRKGWEEHLTYLGALKSAITEKRPHIIMGDFNQRVPRDRSYSVPKRVYEALNDAFEGYSVATANLHPKLIDHIAVAGVVNAGKAKVIDNQWNGRKLSDHIGSSVVVDLTD